MNKRDLARCFSTQIDLRFENLVAGGCSFSHNRLHDHIHAWPYYLRDLGNFSKVHDCTMPGSGNRHISRAVMCAIENDRSLQPENSLVVIMWSGYDRDDFMIDPEAMRTDLETLDRYYYTKDVACGVSGGLFGIPTVLIDIDAVKKIKSPYSRALDNYLMIIGMHHYLKSKGFKHIFTEFSTPETKRDTNFEITDYLPSDMIDRFCRLVRHLQPNISDYGQQMGMPLGEDDYHPSADNQLEWTRNVLLPYLADESHYDIKI